IRATGIPAIELALRDVIAGVGGRGDVASVAEYRIPAAMIGMKMCAKHGVDIVGADTGGGKPFDERCFEHVEERKARQAAPVTNAGINHNDPAVDNEDPALYDHFPVGVAIHPIGK